MTRRAPWRGAFSLCCVIAGLALAAGPRSPFSPGTGVAAAQPADSTATAARADTTTAAAKPDTTAAAKPDTTAATPPTAPSAARPDSTAAVAKPDTTAARADSTAAGSFAAEQPETLRFVPPSDLPSAPNAGPASAPAPAPPQAAGPQKPYGPLPKGVTQPGEAPKERAGIWGLHPAAIIAALVVVHVLVVRMVTR